MIVNYSLKTDSQGKKHVHSYVENYAPNNVYAVRFRTYTEEKSSYYSSEPSVVNLILSEDGGIHYSVAVKRREMYMDCSARTGNGTNSAVDANETSLDWRKMVTVGDGHII